MVSGSSSNSSFAISAMRTLMLFTHDAPCVLRAAGDTTEPAVIFHGLQEVCLFTRSVGLILHFDCAEHADLLANHVWRNGDRCQAEKVAESSGQAGIERAGAAYHHITTI